MRLVDADALRLMKVEECAGHSIEYAMGWKACIEYINAVPTIDAIPVEWLNKQCEMADDRGDMEMTDAISWLIHTWQEKQEAQDGKA